MSVLKTKDMILKNEMLAKGFAGYFSGKKTYTFPYLEHKIQIRKLQATIFLKGSKYTSCQQHPIISLLITRM